MIIILLYARMQRIYSSRQVEQLCERDLLLIHILQGRKVPDHSTFDRFIRHNSQGIEKLFIEVVKQLDSLGELSKDVVYQDGTKMESKGGKHSHVWKNSILYYKEKLIKNIDNLVSETNTHFGWVIQNKSYHQMLQELIETIQRVLKNSPEMKRKTQLSCQKYLRRAHEYKERYENMIYNQEEIHQITIFVGT